MGFQSFELAFLYAVGDVTSMTKVRHGHALGKNE